MALPAPLLELAARQHGVLARRQITAVLGDDRFDGLTRRGHLRRVHHGVVVVAGSPPTPHQAMLAAVLRAGDGARLTGPGVLGLFDVDGFSPGDPFEVLLPPGRRLVRVEFVARPDPLPDADWDALQGISVAGLPLGLIETARHHRTIGDRRLRVGLDSACWKGLTNRERVAAALDHLPATHPGVRWFRRLQESGELFQESEQERDLARALQVVHPQPQRQRWIAPHIRVDFLWPLLKFILEYNGWVDHAPQSPRDVRRKGEAEQLGYEMMVVGAAELREPDALAAEVQLRLVARARQLGVALG
jgi:very-short-patch-repair endonuclease